jgi:hypothetical protein
MGEGRDTKVGLAAQNLDYTMSLWELRTAQANMDDEQN